MIRPEVYAKSSLTEKHIQSKENIGCDGIEIQLLTELIDGKLGQYHYAEDVFDLDSLLQVMGIESTIDYLINITAINECLYKI